MTSDQLHSILQFPLPSLPLRAGVDDPGRIQVSPREHERNAHSTRTCLLIAPSIGASSWDRKVRGSGLNGGGFVHNGRFIGGGAFVAGRRFPVAPVHFFHPYYTFHPRLSLGFGFWGGLHLRLLVRFLQSVLLSRYLRESVRRRAVFASRSVSTG